MPNPQRRRRLLLYGQRSILYLVGYPVLSGSDLVGFSVEDTGLRLEVTSGDLTGVGASGDEAALTWYQPTDVYDWTG